MGFLGSIGDFFKKIGGWLSDFWDWVKKNWALIAILVLIIVGVVAACTCSSESICEKQCEGDWWEINGYLSEAQCIRLCEENNNVLD